MYTETLFKFGEMKGLSQKQITEHIKLYSGYVKNTNELQERILRENSSLERDLYKVAELRRRLGFEYNGMVLHQNYFNSLGGDGSFVNGPLKDEIENSFASMEKWTKEFKEIASTRGIGWVLLVKERLSDTLKNIWISDHEIGYLADTKLILALDVWEHAYLLDYLPSERRNYVEAYFENLDWKRIETNL